MEALDLARWQFGITTVYHFILVPLTIGLSPLVAIMHTAWVRTGNEKWHRLTKFFGKVLLINFALGVATGIVQEFQFGMNWSEYSRFVGDIFGAPLAIEALAAFFLESTFLGLWIFGEGRLPKWLHSACIWLVAIGTNLSAYWILAANSWMQHPVGAVYNPETGRAELDGVAGFFEVMTNNTLIAAFSHTITSAFLVGGTFVAGVCGWWIVRSVRAGRQHEARKVWRTGAYVGLVTMVIAGLGVAVTGDFQGKLMYEQQPAKMSAAEALCEGEESAAFSLLTIGDLSNSCEGVRHLIQIPGVTSFLGTGHFSGEESYLPGVNDIQQEYTERYADQFGTDVDYVPNLAVTYWTFRLMIGLGMGSLALAAAGLWVLRKGRVTDTTWFSRLSLAVLPLPFLGASFGWIFTEMGRQPWVVHPNPANPVDQVYLLTQDGVSTVVSAGTVLTSLVVFTLLYAALGVVWFLLIKRYVLEGVEPLADDLATTGDQDDDQDDASPGGDREEELEPTLSFAY
ncbi:cytochrome bd-I ubiquinol oxidase subunit 1 apoprotein [Georgenia soli]|uniref:Cytochrome bd-I ubiquinol oxidase subunit 1 apoprotein n=1 Tax=Georgenia soli TaxID=638953 RepID=A0A2A9ERG9_9MICO|nr:cytochrome ubiquinol oxidase subunit I [Georgenia soli]PFG40860.1 cytochrome bd-I ubiquinol oxidase subunit 1 apoprotein [Georgenia soli]